MCCESVKDTFIFNVITFEKFAVKQSRKVT